MTTVTPVADESVPDLIRRTRTGDADALAALYARFGADLYRLAHRLTGNAADAEDVVHDVFVGLPEALARYEERGTFASWLKRVAARRALMVTRAHQRRRETALQGADDRGRDSQPTDVVALHVALAGLVPELRAVLVLKEIEGYSHTEIGEVLGISAGASRVRLARALKRLRKLLEDGR